MAVPLRDIGPLLPLLSQRPLGLLSDIDGTLAPIVPDPGAAAVPAETKALLAQLLGRGVRVVLITGRSLEAARRLVDLEGVAYAANHGLTLWLDGREETVPGAEEYLSRAQEVVRELSLVGVPGVEVEEKGPVVAIHYRRAPRAAAAREAILSAVRASSAARAFRVQEGRMVVELRPPLPADKGTAVREMVRRLRLTAVLCLGDDLTDVGMFQAASLLRREGLLAATVAVRSQEAPPDLLASADYSVDGVAGVRWLLGELLKALP